MVVIIGTSQFHILMLHLGLLESLDIRTISDCLEHIKVQGLQSWTYTNWFQSWNSHNSIGGVFFPPFFL